MVFLTFIADIFFLFWLQALRGQHNRYSGPAKFESIFPADPCELYRYCNIMAIKRCFEMCGNSSTQFGMNAYSVAVCLPFSDWFEIRGVYCSLVPGRSYTGGDRTMPQEYNFDLSIFFCVSKIWSRVLCFCYLLWQRRARKAGKGLSLVREGNLEGIMGSLASGLTLLSFTCIHHEYGTLSKFFAFIIFLPMLR